MARLVRVWGCLRGLLVMPTGLLAMEVLLMVDALGNFDEVCEVHVRVTSPSFDPVAV